jgi:hypothetical protein
MRPGLVVEADVVGDEATEVLLTEDEDVGGRGRRRGGHGQSEHVAMTSLAGAFGSKLMHAGFVRHPVQHAASDLGGVHLSVCVHANPHPRHRR